MSARLLLLCPGQGGQHPAMNAMAAGDPAAAAFLAGAPLADGDVFENSVAQPAVVTATMAMWLALRTRLAALRLRPALVAGYSIGELATWGVAGAIAPADLVALAHQRARLMDAATLNVPQTLSAIGGLPLAALERLAGACGYYLAIINNHDSCVVGGPLARLTDLQTALGAQGARCQHLPVTVAAHTPLLASAVAPFAAALEACPFADNVCPVLAGIDGRAIAPGPGARDHAIGVLSHQIAETIRWADCMDTAAEAGITVALELGPGAALSRMLQARHPHIACRSVADFRRLDGIASWLQRQID